MPSVARMAYPRLPVGGTPVSYRTLGMVTRLAAGMIVTGLALAGCGAGTTKAPAAADVIPRVDHPRDVRAVADRPCALLTPQQAASFGIDRPPRQLSGALGTIDCEWRDSQGDVWVYISTFTDKQTLEEVYDQREMLAYFELTEIGGYPAIVSRADATLPACDIDIKPAEQQSVTVSYDSTALNNTPQQGCAVARQVAQAVMLNLPPQADRPSTNNPPTADQPPTSSAPAPDRRPAGG